MHRSARLSRVVDWQTQLSFFFFFVCVLKRTLRINVNLDTEELFLDDDVIMVKRTKGGTLGDDDGCEC